MNEAAAGSGCTLLHVPRFLRPARLRTPLLGYGSPHLSARGTSTLLNNALRSAHFQASDESVTLLAAGYNYDSHWTVLSMGLSPTGMTSSVAAP